MKRILFAVVLTTALVLAGTVPVQGQPSNTTTDRAPAAAEADIGRAIVVGRHHIDNAAAAARSAGAAGGFSRMAVQWRGRDGDPRSARDEGPITLSVYVVAPIAGPVRAGQVLPMHHVGATTLDGRADFLELHLGYLELLVHAALTPAQRDVFHNGSDRYEFRFMASTGRSIGTVGVRGGPTGPVVAVDTGDLQPAGLPPLVMIDDAGRGAAGPRDHDQARTICSSAFGSAFLPDGLQIRNVFTADDRAELTYAKTSPTSIARVAYSSSDHTAVDVGAALWSQNLDFATRKTVARELSNAYSTTVGPNRLRSITTTLYTRQFLLRCVYPNPFNPIIELTRPHMYAEYHAEAAEGLVPRGQVAHRWNFSCANQFRSQVGSRNSGGTWAQHRRVELTYRQAVRIRPGGASTYLVMDLAQRIGRSDEVAITYQKVNRGSLFICGFNFKIPSQSSRVRAQGGCDPKPCRPVLY